MTSITTIAGTTTATVFTSLLRGLRTMLEVARMPASTGAEQAHELPPRLSYDVGLSDLCPDRMISSGHGDSSSGLSRDMMRRGF